MKPLQSTGVCQRHGPGSFNLIRIAHPITGDHACVMILDRFCCIPRKSCRYSFSQELMSKGRIKHKGSTYIYIYIYLSIYTPARNPLSTALIRYLHDTVTSTRPRSSETVHGCTSVSHALAGEWFGLSGSCVSCWICHCVYAAIVSTSCSRLVL